MDHCLYFRSGKFASNRDLADWLKEELDQLGYQTAPLIDEEYMFWLPVFINDDVVNIYMGKNDEAVSPALWQVCFETQVGFFKKLMRKTNKDSENELKSIIYKCVVNNNGIDNAEWENE